MFDVNIERQTSKSISCANLISFNLYTFNSIEVS